VSTETWSARLPKDLTEQARRDGAALGLEGSTEIIKAGLEALHRQARLKVALEQVEEYYGGEPAPLPLGVRASPRRGSGGAPERTRAARDVGQ
jgi:hypothetical protein